MNIPQDFLPGDDPDTGLVRFGYRDYDPDTGRHATLDPTLYAGGDADE